MYLVSVLQNCSKRKEESNYKWKSKESTFEMIKVSPDRFALTTTNQRASWHWQKVKPTSTRLAYFRPLTEVPGNTRVSQGDGKTIWQPIRFSCHILLNGMENVTLKAQRRESPNRICMPFWHPAFTNQNTPNRIKPRLKSLSLPRFQVLSVAMCGHSLNNVRRKKMFSQPNEKPFGWDWFLKIPNIVKKQAWNAKKCTQKHLAPPLKPAGFQGMP